MDQRIDLLLASLTHSLPGVLRRGERDLRAKPLRLFRIALPGKHSFPLGGAFSFLAKDFRPGLPDQPSQGLQHYESTAGMTKPVAPTAPDTRFSNAPRPTVVVNSLSDEVVSVWTKLR